jgi:hypothetical protein
MLIMTKLKSNVVSNASPKNALKSGIYANRLLEGEDPQLLQETIDGLVGDFEVATSIAKPFKRSDAIPRDIVDRLIDNNGELLRNLIDHQSKTEKIIDKLFSFIERKSGSEVAYREMTSMSPVNEEFNNLRTNDK